MARIVLLDAGPLGCLTNPNPPPMEQSCLEWATGLRRKGVTVLVPESADYEVRRSLIRINSGQSLAQLDRLVATFGYLPLDTNAWRCAAELWAEARCHGINTDGDNRIDFDVVLCAQARLLARSEPDVWVATNNIGHLGLLYPQARLWDEITP